MIVLSEVALANVLLNEYMTMMMIVLEWLTTVLFSMAPTMAALTL